MKSGFVHLQQGILLFWAVWFTLVTASDITNFFQIKGFLPNNFIFVSRNYDLIAQYFLTYGIDSYFLIQSVFLIIIIWAFLIAILFWISFFFKNTDFSYLTFFFSFSLTTIFILADEVFIKYEMEHGHIIRLIFQLITFSIFMKITSKN